MGMLKKYAPESGDLELEDSSTIGDVLKMIGIEGETIQAFSVNGSIERSRDRELTDDDELTVLPPVGGG